MTHFHHDHGHGHAHTADTNRLIGAFVVIAVFMVVEFAGGLWSGSLALLADATHMFADAAALGLAASAHAIARKPADDKRHFGYQRMQVLAAFFNGATLVVLMIWIIAEAVQRFIEPREVNAQLMLWVAAAGFAANAAAFAMLQTSKTRNVNVRGALLHVAADLASSVTAIVGALLIMATGMTRVDPVLSIVVALFIGYSAIRLLTETGHILLEGAPKGIDVARLSAGVKQSAPGVEDVHDVRIWQITPEASNLTLHARINSSADADKALDRIKAYLESEYGIHQSTVQIETGEGCPDGAPVNGCGHHHHEPPRQPTAPRETPAQANGHAEHGHLHEPPRAALANQK